MPKPMNLLLVEDDIEDALLFQRRCPANFHVRHVTTIELALAAIRSGDCDVCFTDYRLGSVSGLDLIRIARSEGSRLPIIVITGQDLESLAENALLAGATDFVPKDDIDTATIQRLARWSLIRRHVENQHEDATNLAAITQLMGQTPTPAASMAVTDAVSGGSLRRVLYLSRSRQQHSQQELMLLCSRFATANARTHITGVLIYSGQCFMQVIEGSAEAVEVLLEQIERDARHYDMAVMTDESAGHRLFKDWNMGCLHIGKKSELSPMQWTGVHQQISRLANADSTSRDNIAQMLRVLPGLLGR